MEKSIYSNDLNSLLVNEEDRNNNEFKCLICKSLLIPKDTVQIDCSHLFCKDCIFNNINVTRIKKCPLCQRQFVSYKNISDCNRFAYNILSNLNIKCPYDGCNKILKLGDIDFHIERCEYKLVDCPYCDKKNICRKDLKTHLKENMEDHFLSLVEIVEKIKGKFNNWM